MIKFYKLEKVLANKKTIFVDMFKFHTGNFRVVNNVPKEDILEGEVDEATKKNYPKEYADFLAGVPQDVEPLVIEPIEDIAPEITRASFFDEENDEEKEQEIFIKGK